MMKLLLYGISFSLVLTAPAYAATQITPIPYTALGDSYSSGEGNPPFADRCHRSDAAYPQILPRRVAYLGKANFHACTGAVIANVWRQPQRHWRGQRPQIDYVSATDRLVTLTIGGNDLGFGPVLIQCILRRDCTRTLFTKRKTRLVRKVEKGLESIGPRLRRVYTEIRNRMSPFGYLVVAGYPRLFVHGDRSGCQLGISRREAAWMNSVVIQADGRIKEAVRRARAKSGNIFYVDVRREFSGRELCTDSPLLHGLMLATGEGIKLWKGSYHPTAPGQTAYAEAFLGFLSRPEVRLALTG